MKFNPDNVRTIRLNFHVEDFRLNFIRLYDAKDNLLGEIGNSRDTAERDYDVVLAEGERWVGIKTTAGFEKRFYDVGLIITRK